MQILRTSDGKGELKYFEHDKVELRYNNSGFVITIYKPGRFRYYNTNSAYKCPMITVGQSDTKRWTFTDRDRSWISGLPTGWWTLSIPGHIYRIFIRPTAVKMIHSSVTRKRS